MLINYKSWIYGYGEEDKKQLMYILRKQKEWNGDVWMYFYRKGWRAEFPQIKRYYYGNRYTRLKKVGFCAIEDLPF